MPRKPYDSQKVNIVGDFFEDMIEAMFIGIKRAHFGEGDFCIWSAGSGLEVKSSDSNHEIRIPLRQLEDYHRISQGFPFDTFFYLLFFYDNPNIKTDDGREVTSMSGFSGLLEVRDFLASSPMTLFVIEESVVPYLFSIGRISDKSIPLNRGVKSLNIRQKKLEQLVSGGWKLLPEGPKNLRTAQIEAEISFSKYVLEERYKVRLNIKVAGRPGRIEKLTNHFDPKSVSVTKHAS